MVTIRPFFLVSTPLRDSILLKGSYDIITVELLALCADNIFCIMHNRSKGMCATLRFTGVILFLIDGTCFSAA